jgi:hypothetical protein
VIFCLKELLLSIFGFDVIDEAQNTTRSYIVDMLANGEVRLILGKFHEFADWIVKEEDIDVCGMEL